jgi:Flp pilus assembly pilin Flp
MWTKISSLLLPLYTRTQIARDEAGQAMVEYTLIVALISVVAVVAITAVGGDISAAWNTVKEKF